MEPGLPSTIDGRSLTLIVAIRIQNGKIKEAGEIIEGYLSLK